MKLLIQNRWGVVMLCFGLSFFLTACPKKQTVKKEPPVTEELDEKVESEELSIHGKEFVSTKGLKTVYFEYDSMVLSQETRETLASNAEYLKKNSNIEILAEGHCDERGTVGYNLALGQKRAAAVRKYYTLLGIKPKRIGALSYGKEKPICMESSEGCWPQNRRAETKIRAMNVTNNGKTNESSNIKKN